MEGSPEPCTPTTTDHQISPSKQVTSHNSHILGTSLPALALCKYFVICFCMTGPCWRPDSIQ